MDDFMNLYYTFDDAPSAFYGDDIPGLDER